MSEESDKKVPSSVCSLCGRPYWGADPDLCSKDCQTSHLMFTNNLLSTLSTAPTGDPRTFFYDASFGALMGLWMGLCLKRMACRDVPVQQELDFQMHRIRRSLQTKLSVRNPADMERTSIGKLARSLFEKYCRGWWLNNLARDQRYADEDRVAAAKELLALADARAALVRQLDLIMAGRTHAYRYYA